VLVVVVVVVRNAQCSVNFSDWRQRRHLLVASHKQGKNKPCIWFTVACILVVSAWLNISGHCPTSYSNLLTSALQWPSP
jgi:hypothetical protein